MKVEILQRRDVFDDFFRIEEARLRYERFDGTMSAEARRLVFARGDSAAALVVDRSRGVVLLTRQFRYPAHASGQAWLLEVVAGMVGRGESPQQCIRREIEEEIGYRAPVLTPVATFFVSPGGSSERIFLYCAEVGDADRIGQGGGLDTENEDIQTVALPIDELPGLLARGELSDAKTIIGVQWLLARPPTETQP